jgi:beta-lactamase class A
MKTAFARCLVAVLALAACAVAQARSSGGCCPEATDQKQALLWQKLEKTIRDVDDGLDGVMGVAILDLTSGQKLLLNADEVFPQASSIKIAVLAELYRQHQQAQKGATGKARLTDTYAVNPADVVADRLRSATTAPPTC